MKCHKGKTRIFNFIFFHPIQSEKKSISLLSCKVIAPNWILNDCYALSKIFISIAAKSYLISSVTKLRELTFNYNLWAVEIRKELIEKDLKFN